ncbi:DUF3099 domain-containing protein [Dermacoccaceae bacterium W4C1]
MAPPASGSGPADSVPSATNLPVSPRGDHDARVRNYLISMGIRTLCFVLAFFFDGPIRWICVALAVVLPYIAVIFANATQQRRIAGRGSVAPQPVNSRIETHPRNGDGPAA